MRSAINQFCDFTKGDLSVTKQGEFFSHLLDKGYYPATVRTYHSYIKGFLLYIVQMTGKEIEPFKLPMKNEVNLIKIDPEKIEKTIQCLKRQCKKTYEVSLILKNTGMRISELINVDNLLIRGNILIVRGKGGKERIIPVDDETKQLLRKWKEHQISEYKIWRCLKRCGDVTPHQFRHYYAITMLNKGLTIYEVAKLLGHTSIATTSRYLEVTDKTLINRVLRVLNES